MSGSVREEGGPADTTTLQVIGDSELIRSREPAAGAETDTTVALSEFQKQNPPVFRGEPEPRVTEPWLRQVEKILNALCITDDQTRVSLAASQLEEEADQWWHSIGASQEAKTLTWQKFRDLFLGKYFPPILLHALEQEFLELVQRNRTIMEYEAKFAELARYAHELVPDEETRIRRFIRGLKTSIRGKMSLADIHSYSEAVDRALIEEREINDAKTLRAAKRQRTSSASESQSCQGHWQFWKGSQQPSSGGTFAQGEKTCHHCRQPGHYRKECPQKGARRDFSRSSQPQQYVPTQQGTSFASESQSSSASESESYQGRRQFRKGSQQPSHGGTFPRGEKTCHHCRQPGHYRKECPQKGARRDFSRSSHPQQYAPTQQATSSASDSQSSSASESESYQGRRQFQKGSQKASKQPRRGTFAQGQMACYFCKQPGHYQHECPRRLL